jgi:autotransporter-associated beta strand protein
MFGTLLASEKRALCCFASASFHNKEFIMKNCDMMRILRIAAPALLVFIALAVYLTPAAAQAPIVGTQIFKDNFNYTGDLTCNGNINVTDPTRQSGDYVGTTYTGFIYKPGGGTESLFDGDVGPGYIYMGKNTNTGDGTPALAMTGNYGGWPFPYMRLDKNWNNGLSQGGMTISYDMNINGPYWGGLVFGGGVSCNGGGPWADTGPNFMYRAGINVNTPENPIDGMDGWDGQSSAGTGSFSGVDIHNTWHHFDVVCTDPVDGNPFDGQNETDIAVYLDNSSTSCYTYQKLGGGYTDNYLGFMTLTNDPGPNGTAYTNGGNYYCNFDNLTIYGYIPNQWGGATTGNWTEANWTSYVPNSPGEVARFWNKNTAPATVTVDDNVTIGTMNFDSPRSYTIAAVEGKSITLNNTGGTGNALIVVQSGTHEISAPLVQTGNLDIKVTSASDKLTISGTVAAHSFDWNVNDPTSGTLLLTGVANPSNVTLSGGALEIAGSGSLTANSAVNVNAGAVKLTGGTLTTSYILGDGQLWLDGGVLLSPARAKPIINVDVLGLGIASSTSGSYSLDAGETITVRGLVGNSGDPSTHSEFHFNGGYIAARSADLIVQQINATYLDADISLSNGGGLIYIIDAHLQDGASSAGHLILNGETYITGVAGSAGANTYSGGTTLTSAELLLGHPNGLGTGDVELLEGTSFWGYTSGCTGTVPNNLTFHGKPTGVETTIYLDWGAAPNLAGTITVNNNSADEPTNIGGTTYQNDGHVLTISGQITGPGGLMFGFPNASWQGAWNDFRVVLSGDTANDYKGDTLVLDCNVTLAKTGGAYAIPSANLTIGHDLSVYPQYTGVTNAIATVRLGGDNQINPACVLHFFAPAPETGYYNEFSLMGHSQTIGGLRSDEGLNVIGNSFFDATGCAGTVGVLTVNSTSPDDYYHGLIRDNFVGSPAGGQIAIVKDGSGTLTFSAKNWLWYTGPTTIKNGTLKITANNTLAGDVVRGDASSGTLAVSHADGATSPTVLRINGHVDLGTATISAGDSLMLTSATANAIDTVAGDTGSTLQVTTGSSLTSSSITVGSLVIGGDPPAPAPYNAGAIGGPAPVPEPSTLVLLALAGLGVLVAAWRRK